MIIIKITISVNNLTITKYDINTFTEAIYFPLFLH